MADDVDTMRGRDDQAPPADHAAPPADHAAPLGSQSRGHAGEDQFVSLYRRFRPSRFAELRGQPHVVRALQGAVRDERVAHAYLFSGPRGTGKTSTARILARALNCTNLRDGEPCGSCVSCVEIARGASLDVHELDAASNNGVDAMRDLISHAALATPGRWKVYIVDEVHMLSNAAANALLKTLEEPPAHVVFVLATTDPQKVPATIKSRTQHLEFGLLGADTLTQLLRDVNAAAGLELQDVALSVAVRKARGSARDALSALDQVAASGTADALRPDVAELTDAIAEEDARRALVAVAQLHESGWGPQQLATELVDDLRQAFLVALAPDLCAAVGADRERLTAQASRAGLPRLVRSIEALGKAQVDMRDAPDARAVLEVALVRLTRPELDDTTGALLDRLAHLEQAVASGAGQPRTLPASAPALHAPPPPSPSPTPSAALSAASSPPAPARPAPEATARSEAPTDTAGSSSPASTGPAPTSTAPGDRPGFGALRRQRAARSASQAPGTAEAAPAGSGGGTEPTAGTSESQPATASGPATARVPAPPAAPADHSAPAPSSAATPDRDAVVEAWGDHILRGLPARAKALYSAGRFVSVDGGTAVFALPNAAHRDRCEEVRKQVEQAISSHFGAPVRLRLSVDEDPGTSAAPRVGVTGADGGVPDIELGLDPDDDFDPDAPAAHGSVESAAQARLLEAFPGAEEVRG